MNRDALPDNPNRTVNYQGRQLKTIYLAGGCFWGTQAYLARVLGVASTTVGYANGSTEHPTYEDVCWRHTGHAETVEVSYDPTQISLRALLEQFFLIIDPTLVNRQGNDKGTQYRSGIYFIDPADQPIIESAIASEQLKYKLPIVTEVLPLSRYDRAEAYHQEYLEKNPTGYCHVSFETLPTVVPTAVRFVKPELSDLKKKLSPLQYAVAVERATEHPFSGEYWREERTGLYVDVATGEPLFSSKDKYDAGCGWPSFTRPVDKAVVREIRDQSHGLDRVEIRSQIGDFHLGHVFTDGPVSKGGLRYCINSASLRFIPLADLEREGYGEWLILFQ
ncbi:MAG: peptide-methionine (R)-S-oxide reductase MsrB [Eubacteriales bacterium]|nr:peptide-methionine (R)-S-oxide reductase MsrB [Eubacteriales bacterium]